jgi:Tfp pilus assembly protein FimT
MNKTVAESFHFDRVDASGRSKLPVNEKGITLIELIIVFVIIAIGAVLMAPNIGAWLPHYRLKSGTRDVVSAMRTAQMKAVSSNIPYGVAFDGNACQIYRNSGGLQPDGGQVVLSSGVQFSNNTFPVNPALSKPYAEFNTNSTASSGRITLQNSKGFQKTITVVPSTGRIRLESD